MNRKITKSIQISNVTVGGGSKILIQSMLNAPAENSELNVAQAIELQKCGCEIIRVSIPTIKDVQLIDKIKSQISVPLVADIHYDSKIAIESIHAGIDKIRINPGNMGSDEGIRKLAESCKKKNIPIRIGVNSGSLEKNILGKYGYPTAEALCESAIYHASLLEKYDFNDIVLSVKSSNVGITMEANKLLSEKTNYPLHLGVTEAGTYKMGLLKSAIGIGSLLAMGIGDTIRVSLTDDPIREISAAKDIIKASGAESDGVNIISCPTCGRTKINLIELANKVEAALGDCKKNITVAVMGCTVNGIGEGKHADIGIAGGDGIGIIFKKGKLVVKCRENQLLDRLLDEIEKM